MKKTLHSKEYRKLVKWLKAERVLQGLTIRNLADKLDVAHSFVGKVEQAERRLDVIEYIKYCGALNISPIVGLEVIINSKNKKQ